MRAIDAGDVQRLIARLTREGKEPKTIRNVWGTISLIWQAGLAQKFVDSTLPKPKLPKNVKKKPRFFTLSDVARIIASAPGQQRCLYWLLAETGIRAGELGGTAYTGRGTRQHHRGAICVGRGRAGAEDAECRQNNCDLNAPCRTGLGNKSDGRKRWATRSCSRSSTGSPLDMNVERSRRLAPVLETLELDEGRVSCLPSLQRVDDGCVARAT